MVKLTQWFITQGNRRTSDLLIMANIGTIHDDNCQDGMFNVV